MATFIAIVRGESSGGYTASFPDFPGLVVDAASVDLLLAKARGVLAGHIEGLLDTKQTIVAPTPADAVDRHHALLLAAIELPDDLRTTRINVWLPALSLVRIDAFAQRQGLTRSALIAAAVERWQAEENVSDERRGPTLFDLGNPLEVRAEAIAAAVAPLSATEPEQPAKSEVENISDITAELVRLLEETEPQPSAAGADDQARRAP